MDAPSLLGRDAELAVLRTAVQRTAEGAPGTVLVTGEVGIGKTTLLRELQDLAAAAGVPVAVATADQLSPYTPFGVVAAALTAGREPEGGGAVTQLIDAEPDAPTFEAAAPDWRFRVTEGFVDLVDTRTRTSPLAVVLDDLQWADVPSLTVVEQLAQRLLARPLLLALAWREHGGGEELRALEERLSSLGAAHLRLRGLRPDDARGLAAAVLGAPPGQRLLARVDTAEGNPLLIAESLRAARVTEAIVVEDGVAELVGEDATMTAGPALLRWLDAFPSGTRDLLRVAAVVGAPVAPALLAAVLHRPVTDVLADVELALRAGVLVDGADGLLRFRHDLLREVLEQDLVPSIRRALHREVGTALIARDADAATIAHHLRLGATPGDVAAVTWLHRAAAARAGRDPALAAALLQDALALAGDDQRTELQADLATVLVWDRVEEAAAHAQEVVAAAPAANVDARARVVLHRALMMRGDWVGMLQQVDLLAEHPGLDEIARLRIVADSIAGHALGDGDLETALSLGERTRAAADGRDDAAYVSACAGMASAAYARTHLALAREHAEAAVQRALVSGDAEVRRRHPHIPYAFVLLESDRFEAMGDAVEAGQAVGDRFGSWQLPLYHMEEGIRRCHLGDWDQALVAYETGLRLAESTGTQHADQVAHGGLAFMAVHRGDLAGANAALAAGQEALARGGGGAGIEWLLLAQALTLDAEGRSSEALATLGGFWDLTSTLGVTVARRFVGPVLLQLARVEGDDDRARVVVTDLEETAAVAEVAGFDALAQLCRAVLGDDAGAVQAALDLTRTSPRVPERATLLELAGRWQLDRAQAGAVGTLTEAARTFASFGASGSVARCERLLERTEGRGRSRPDRPRTGWGSLTPSQWTVVELAAEGLTNAEVAERLHLSRYTVETHLKHVYAKLELRSRVELARAFALRDGPAGEDTQVR